MKYCGGGKDKEVLPCVELEDGKIINEGEILLGLIKALIKKKIIQEADIKAELV